MIAYQKKRLTGSAVVAISATVVWIFLHFYTVMSHSHRLTQAVICVALLINSAYWAVLARNN